MLLIDIIAIKNLLLRISLTRILIIDLNYHNILLLEYKLIHPIINIILSSACFFISCYNFATIAPFAKIATAPDTNISFSELLIETLILLGLPTNLP